MSNFFGGHKSKYEKENVHHKKIVKDLGLLVVKNHLPIPFVESIWLKCLVMQLWHCVVFPFKKTLKFYQTWSRRKNKHMSY